MEVKIDKSFRKDLIKIKDRSLRIKIVSVIEDVEKADSAGAIKDIAKIRGTSGYYRIRIGNYRLGIIISGSTVEFIRCLHRKDIYKYFPK